MIAFLATVVLFLATPMGAAGPSVDKGLFEAAPFRPDQQEQIFKQLTVVNKSEALSNITIERSIASRPYAYSSLLNLAFTIRNANDFAVKDLEIQCSYHGASETIISSAKRTIYEIFPAKKQKTVKGIDFGLTPNQGKTVSCEVLRFQETAPESGPLDL